MCIFDNHRADPLSVMSKARTRLPLENDLGVFAPDAFDRQKRVLAQTRKLRVVDIEQMLAPGLRPHGDAPGDGVTNNGSIGSSSMSSPTC